MLVTENNPTKSKIGIMHKHHESWFSVDKGVEENYRHRNITNRIKKTLIEKGKNPTWLHLVDMRQFEPVHQLTLHTQASRVLTVCTLTRNKLLYSSIILFIVM
jgi:hypothetical protein